MSIFQTSLHASLRQICLGLLVLLALAGASHAQTPEKCVATITDLKVLLGDPAFPLQWSETTMDDGKPLKVSITEKNGVMSVAFVKSGKGLWADITGRICQADKDFEIRFNAGQIRFGPASSWVLRYVMGNGGSFTLKRISAQQLQVATTGWSGMFVPMGLAAAATPAPQTTP